MVEGFSGDSQQRIACLEYTVSQQRSAAELDEHFINLESELEVYRLQDANVARGSQEFCLQEVREAKSWVASQLIALEKRLETPPPPPINKPQSTNFGCQTTLVSTAEVVVTSPTTTPTYRVPEKISSGHQFSVCLHHGSSIFILWRFLHSTSLCAICLH